MNSYRATPENLAAPPIPAFEYRGALVTQRQEILAAFERVLDSGCLILGPEVRAFEQAFAQFVGAAHATGVSSGTDALIIALRALEIGPGAEVITVANGPVPTIAAIRAVGATPRFVDIDAHTLQMSPQLAAQAINAQTRCILPVHLYGYPANINALLELCQQHRLVLIEDCAQAHGTYVAANHVSRHVGTFGAIGCFSFYPTKNLGAFGDAGMCVTDDPQLAERLRELACYGFRGDRVAHREGLNCRLDELQAAALNVRLKYLPAALARRQAIAQRYRDGLASDWRPLPPTAPGDTAAWHQFVVRVADRVALIQYLAAQGIDVGIHYASPVHIMPAYQFLGYEPGSLPSTEQACQQGLSLPIYPELTDSQVDRVVAALDYLDKSTSGFQIARP
ncbi:MAG: DegT/DnrJ/EryC1/StrS family aminotransferase [Pirellulaceae bacterium]|nr:DegT/DnrJ/EryC1/StrS family aminotransferase [Pirellulaceae bacterium]